MNLLIKYLSTATLLFASFLTLFFIGCEKKGVSESEHQIQYYRKAQLKNIYENQIAKLTQSFTDETNLLIEATNSFKNKTDLTNLVTIQNQWKSVQLVWKQLELYDLGTISDNFITSEINRWPTDQKKINTNIASTDIINESYINTKGSSSKGISAIENLIYSITDDNATLLNTFTEDSLSVRRIQYLIALSENLHQNSLKLKTLWDSDQVSFINSLENGISGSQNQVINAMVTLIEEIIITKLGKPLGDTNGGIIEAKRLEAYKSGFSKEIIQQHLTALQKCYTGDFTKTPFQIGFDDFLILIGREKLATHIMNQFIVCQEKATAIKGSLKNEITSNPKNVTELKNAFRDLLVLLKVDMANVLGSTITFNDNDGD